MRTPTLQPLSLTPTTLFFQLLNQIIRNLQLLRIKILHPLQLLHSLNIPIIKLLIFISQIINNMANPCNSITLTTDLIS